MGLATNQLTIQILAASNMLTNTPMKGLAAVTSRNVQSKQQLHKLSTTSFRTH
jgi:hypothetical protein